MSIAYGYDSTWPPLKKDAIEEAVGLRQGQKRFQIRGSGALIVFSPSW